MMRNKVLRAISANLSLKLIAIALAFVFWFLVMGSRLETVTKEVPLVVTLPTNLVVSNEIPESVAFQLSGPKAFMRSILDRKESPISVNLLQAQAGSMTYRFSSESIRLPLGIKIQSIQPSSIIFKLESLYRKTVPVKAQIVGVVPEGMEINQIKIEPESVTLKGARGKLLDLKEISTMPIDVSEFSASFSDTVNLDLPSIGVELEGQPPKVSIDVVPAGGQFRIPNVRVEVLANSRVRMNQRKVSLLVRAPAKLQPLLSGSHFKARIDLRGLPKGEQRGKVLVEAPDGVEVLRIFPDRINVSLY